MKSKTLALVGVMLTLAAVLTLADPLGTTFTYQGRLTVGGSAPEPAERFDFRFSLFDVPAGGIQLTDTVTHVSIPFGDGRFTLPLDFGSNVFTGAGRWLQIDVRAATNDPAAPYTPLTPRQPLTAAPYALYSPSAGTAAVASNLLGMVVDSQLPASIARGNEIFPTVLADDGTGSGLDADRFDGLDSTAFWQLGGNGGTTPGMHFLGTTDNQPLELVVNSARVLRLEPNADSPNVIAGFSGNYIPMGIVGATIMGGGKQAQNGTNRVTANYGTVAGGLGNAASGMGSSVGGGAYNIVHTSATESTIAGGNLNAVETNASFATIGGGHNNLVLADADYATIPGGQYNLASGDYTFAAGRRAQAGHAGAFVWADSTDSDFSSTGPNQFLIRAGGGIGIGTNTPTSALHVAGTVTANAFQGDGTALTAINGDNVSSGTIPQARVDPAIARDTEILPTVLANDGSGSGLDADRLDGLDATAIWTLAGNSGTTPGTHFLGTVDNQPLELKVNNRRAFRLEYATDGGSNPRPNVIGGYINTISTYGSVVGGGDGNDIGTNSAFSAIGGGLHNEIQGGSRMATIAGGMGNGIGADADYSTIAGGAYNSIGTNSRSSVIGGGDGNTITTDAEYATIPGGVANTATNYAFAAGRRAKANHTGAFVWGDSTAADVASTAADQFTIRASNGVRLTQNAGAGKTINVGDRYRDNALVAWAKVSSGGNLQAEFGVTSATNSATGAYNLVLDVSAADANSLVPLAVAEVDAPPFSAGAARLVTVNQTGTSTFTVYISNGNYAAVNNDFTFMVTGR